MLSDRNVREMNRLIEEELRTARSICSDHEEKMAALERVAKLKSLLDPQPTTQAIAEDVLSYLGQSKEPRTETFVMIDSMHARRR